MNCEKKLPGHLGNMKYIHIYIYIFIHTHIIYISNFTKKKLCVFKWIHRCWAAAVLWTHLSPDHFGQEGGNATCRRTAHLEPTKLETSEPTGGDSIRFHDDRWAKKPPDEMFSAFFFLHAGSLGIFSFFFNFGGLILWARNSQDLHEHS